MNAAEHVAEPWGGPGGPPELPERLLRHLWGELHLALDRLRTTDGAPLTVVRPGRLNGDSGPDYLEATLRFGDGPVRTGAVEIHLRRGDWSAHGHERDRRYNQVLLHAVVWPDGPLAPARRADGIEPPTLILSEYLSAPLRTLLPALLRAESAASRGDLPCAFGMTRVSEGEKIDWIDRLAPERFQSKIDRLRGRLDGLIGAGFDPNRGSTWTQLLYEAVADGLGYSKNREPFTALARRLPLAELRHRSADPDPTERRLRTETVLFGAAGLLPTADDDGYTAALRDRWPLLNSGLVPMAATDWQFFRLRPANFPTVRLAALAALSDRLPTLLADATRALSLPTIRDRATALRSLLTIPAEGGYWATHHRFGGSAHEPAAHLVGRDRADDLILNAVLPTLALGADLHGRLVLAADVAATWLGYPKGDDNETTRRLGRVLFGPRAGAAIRTAGQQQGMIQLDRAFCSPLHCLDCAIGRRVFGALPTAD